MSFRLEAKLREAGSAGTTHCKTSLGSPSLENTSALAWVYPYGPDLYRRATRGRRYCAATVRPAAGRSAEVSGRSAVVAVFVRKLAAIFGNVLVVSIVNS